MTRRRRRHSPETQRKIAHLKAEIDTLLAERALTPFPDMSGLDDIKKTLQEDRLSAIYCAEQPQRVLVSLP